MSRRSHPEVYRVPDEDDVDPYNAPTKLAPNAAAQARQLLVERLPPSNPIPIVYDEAVEDGDPAAPNGTMIMVNAPRRSPPARAPWPSQPEFRIHVQVTEPPPAQPRQSSRRRRSWIDRLPTAFLVAVIVGSLVVGAAGVAMFLYYC